MTRRDAMYARYSSHNQDDSTSIEVQVEACERAAGGGLWHFIDQAKTGRTMGGRTELLRLIREAESGSIGRLFVYKFDRLGRAAETHVLVEDLEACGVEVISVTEGTNALARGVQLVVAADYSRALAERVRAGLVQRHRQGFWTGGPPPFGYRIVTEDGRPRTKGDWVGRAARESARSRLVPDDAEAKVVRLIFRMYVGETVGMREIARRLNERGVPTRLGGPWQMGTVRSILMDRRLVGEVLFLRRAFRLNKGTGRRVPRSNAAARHEMRADETLRVVEDELFERAQALMADSAVGRPKGVLEVRPFTRHIFCGVCGGVCYASKSGNAKGAYRYYRCGARTRVGSEACANAASIREDILLGRVRTALGSVFDDVDGLLAEVGAVAGRALEANRAEVARLKREIAAIDRTIAGLSRVLVDQDVEPAAKRSIARQIGEAEGRREGLRESLQGLAVRAVQDGESLLSACRQAVLQARDDFASVMSPARLNRFIGEVVGPMELAADGDVGQRKVVREADAMRTMGIAGVRRARRPHPSHHERQELLAMRAMFWPRFRLVA